MLARSTLPPIEAVRVTGGIRVSAGVRSGRSQVVDLQQSGGYRLAFPMVEGDHIEAAQINTGGGVAGGDRVSASVEVGMGADLVFSTQGAERIYRSTGSASQVNASINVAPDGRLDWLPQQTILYAGARLERCISVDMAATSCLLMAEIVTFGRPASREADLITEFSDSWRVRRDGRLVLAEEVRLKGRLCETLGRPAVAPEARAHALLLHIAPDAEDRSDEVRATLQGEQCEHGVSAWNGMLVVRLLGRQPSEVVATTLRLGLVIGRRSMPRVWSI